MKSERGFGLFVLTRFLHANRYPLRSKTLYNGNSGSRRALRRAVVTEGDAVERTKVQRMLEACRESCRITIWAVRRG
ncbi:hypothetical protein, partial [Bradyrhizobium sp. S69]|uniref:hypothetical protein n=1 Tax=Bradyrhizobium sp. S69 TaxID=1641856 RepID=UPI001AED33E5